MQEIKIDEEGHKKRIDSFLATQFSDISRSRWRHRIERELVFINSKTCKCSQKLQQGDRITIHDVPSQVLGNAPQDIPLDILYEDDDVIVINKEVGMVVHPAPGHEDGTLVNALLHHVPNLNIGDSERPGIVHRLDKDTSGVMVCAKSQIGMECLSKQFRERTIKKEYMAFCYGQPKKDDFILHTGHVRHPKDRKKYTTKIPPPESEENGPVRHAKAHYFVDLRGGGVSMIRVLLETGRTHQIRAQLADYGFPLLGDVVYGGKYKPGRIHHGPMSKVISRIKRQALHSYQLTFHLPNGDLKSIKAPLKNDLHEIAEFLPQID